MGCTIRIFFMAELRELDFNHAGIPDELRIISDDGKECKGVFTEYVSTTKRGRGIRP